MGTGGLGSMWMGSAVVMLNGDLGETPPPQRWELCGLVGPGEELVLLSLQMPQKGQGLGVCSDVRDPKGISGAAHPITRGSVERLIMGQLTEGFHWSRGTAASHRENPPPST